MKDRTILEKRLETYHDIFLSIAEWARKSITRIAKDIGHTGRGRRRATISEYLQDMYNRQIIFNPNLLLKTFENPQWKAFFLKNPNEKEVFNTFKKLSSRVSYCLFLSGKYDYFVTCPKDHIDFESLDIDVVSESVLYTPIFTKPSGWNQSLENALQKMSTFPFEKGLLERPVNGTLPWDDLDLRIFDLMKGNARKEYTEVARKTGVTVRTVKTRFLDNIVPHCEFAHYFFPMEYSYYDKTFFIIHSDYEKSLVKAFHLLPCTTYVYPFEEGIGCNIFHKNINDLMTMMEKLKIEKVLDSYSMFVPLRHD
ncbi:MAG: hypothetical protein WBA22_08160 [Candidatus Methanofastidiosia archaeon]